MTLPLFPRPWFFGGVLGGAVLVWAATHRSEPPSSPPTTKIELRPEPPPVALPATWTLDQPPSAAEMEARIASWFALTPPASSYAERALGLRALLVLADAGQLAALADCLARRGGDDDSRWFAVVFGRWTALDAAAATRWTSTLGAANRMLPATWTKAREQAALAWAKSTFDPAYAWAVAEPDAEKPEGVAARLLGLLAELDPARALALAEARGTGAAAAMLRPIFDTWAKRDPEAALRALGPRLLAGKVTPYDLSDSLKSWLQKSPDAAFAWMGTQPLLDKWRSDGLGSILASGNDRQASVAAVLRLSDAELQYGLLSRMLIFSWPVDQEQAAALIDKLEDPELRARLLRESLRVSFPGNPERSLPFALRLAPGTERDARLVELTSAWARKDPVAALAWFQSHNEPAVAATVQAAALGAIAQDEPQTALATWAGLPAGPVRDRAVEEIIKGWAKQAPAEAAAWLDSQYAARDPKQESRYETMESLMKAWTVKDADASLVWAETRNAGAARDNTPLYAWAREIAKSLPVEKAADQIGRIRDEPTRRQALFNHVNGWLSSDRVTAEAWLVKQTFVSPETARAWVANAREEATR